MKIKCKICNTVYDNKDKYCPYCFNRTKRTHDCYNLNSEDVYSKDKYKQTNQKLYEGKAINQQRERANSFNYQKRTTTRYNNKKNTNPVAFITTLIFIIFGIMFFSIFMTIFMNLFFFF